MPWSWEESGLLRRSNFKLNLNDKKPAKRLLLPLISKSLIPWMESVCVLLKKIPASFWRQQQNQQATSGPLLITGFLAYVLAPDTSKDECKVKWCAIGHHERTKCDRWSGFSVGAIECETAENTEECIAKIMVRPSCLHRATCLPPLPTCPRGWVSVPGNYTKSRVPGNLTLSVGGPQCGGPQCEDPAGSSGPLSLWIWRAPEGLFPPSVSTPWRAIWAVSA